MPSSSDTTAPTPLTNNLRALIAAGIRAPSGDNCQPWQFRLDARGEHLDIDLLPERAKSFFDYQHSASFLSVGAVVENLRIEAANLGFRLNVDYLGGQAPGDAAARISLAEDEPAATSAQLEPAMLRRSVNRRPYFRIQPSSEQRQALVAHPIKGTHTKVLTDRNEIKTWARLIYLADRIRYSHPVIHEELFGKILLSREQINSRRMGLEFDRLGIGPGSTGILKLLKPWQRMQKLARFGVDKGLSNQSRMLALSSGAIVLVTIDENSAEYWMRSGEQIERLWVAAEHLGLCVHPMTVALYLSQRYKAEGMENFLPKHEPLLKEIGTLLQPFLGSRVGAMVFRLGKAMKMSGTAIRLPIDDFLPGKPKAQGKQSPDIP